MHAQQITTEAMALPLAERVTLAQTLWQSIDTGLPDVDDSAAISEAIRRDQEMTANKALGRSHQEVIDAARRAIGCA